MYGRIGYWEGVDPDLRGVAEWKHGGMAGPWIRDMGVLG